MTAKELNALIEQEAKSGKNPHSLPEEEMKVWAAQLKQSGDEAAFNALFPLAVAKQDWAYPAVAAPLLLRVNPKCPLSCQDALRALLPEWDISIEETVFYLAKQFGSPALRQAATEIQPSLMTKSERVTLDTVIYWLGIWDERVQR
jgi:hypothetical protein